MTAKHDGKHARMHMWVTHQNLASAKGGRPRHQYKEKPPVKKRPAAPPPSPEPTPADVPPTNSEASAEDTKE